MKTSRGATSVRTLPPVVFRLRTPIAAGLLLAVLAAGAARAGEARPASVRAFVAAEGEARLVAFDLGSASVLRRIPVAPGPHNVTASADGRLVLVTSPPSGRVTLVTAGTLRGEAPNDRGRLPAAPRCRPR